MKFLKISPTAVFAVVLAATIHPALAVDNLTWDSSGNNLLSGTYNFREVSWRNKGDFHRIAIYGSMVFDGNGGFTLTSSVMDSNNSSVQTFSTTGAYRIAASGMGFMDDPNRIRAANPNSTVWGLVSQGIFVGSSTDDGINSLFIAAKAPSPAPANASFNGSYWAAGVNLPSNDVNQASDMLFSLNPNGQGSLGAVSLSGFVGSSGTAVTQTVNLGAYSFANGIMTLSLGTGPLISGNSLIYLSSDGNFFFGGSATGWDMIVGVKTSSAPQLNGLYYQAGVDVAPSKGFDNLASYYGSFTAGSGTIIGHQRVLPADALVGYVPYDYTYSDKFTLAADGTHDDFLGMHNVVGAGGAIRIGYGNTSRRGINVALRAPSFSGSGVYLNPTGIANAASSAPFTVGVSPGGFIALYGTNLSASTLQDNRMPFSLGNVQVKINGRSAPIYYVRPDVILAIVPYATKAVAEPVAQIQVINNGVASEVRTVRVKNGTPGIYTNPPGGVGIAIAQHVQDNSYATITRQNPAKPGETILLYLTGLGDVNPPVPDGVAAPLSPVSNAITQPIALVDGEQANVGFAGLTPTIVGLYAITLTIPSDLASGDAYVDISLPDSYTTEAILPIGTSNLRTDQPGAAVSGRILSPKEPPVGIPGASRRLRTR